MKYLLSSVQWMLSDILLNRIINSSFVVPHLRWILLRMVGIRTARSVVIASGAFFGGRNIRIGPGVAINVNAFFDSSATITIEPRVNIGPDVMIITSTHETGGPRRRAGALGSKPVTIKSGAWIGARVTILPGVTIGEGCIIAAGAVVTKSTHPHHLYAGTPAMRKFPLSQD